MKKQHFVLKISMGLLVFCFMVACMAFSVFASEKNAITFGCTEFDAVREETFSTTIYVQEDSGVTGFDLTLVYNSEYITLIEYNVLQASEVNVTDNTIVINYAGADNIETALQLVELTFVVDENVGDGLYTDWLKWTQSTDDSAFTTTGFNNNIPQYEDLTIHTDFAPLFVRKLGDAFNNNYDGKINARDASYVLQHSAHMFTMPEVDQRYANAYNADDPTDGIKISARDASIVLQYAAHMGITLSDRVNITFYSLNENDEYVVDVVKSVKRGSSLSNLPVVPSKGEYMLGNWSTSHELNVEPNFSNITANMSVYAYYEQQEIPNPNKLDTPVITSVKHDKITWTAVNNADTYTVRVNDNYECTLRGTTCSLNNVLWNGNKIIDYGIVSVTVWANGYDEYESSECATINNSYFYVPETDIGENLDQYSIGYGYNIIEDDYLDITKASQNSIFNVNKLLTIGNYVVQNNSSSEGHAYNYSSIDEFISKTQVSFEYGQTTGCALIGSLQMQIGVDYGFDYRTYSYNETYIYEYRVTYKDHVIKNFSDDNLLKYCLSETFLKDINRESVATQNLSDSELAKYIYELYGTHAILGITTGGSYFAQSVVSTNEKNIASKVKTDFSVSTSGGAIDQIIQTNFNVSGGIGEDLSWNDKSSEAHFYTYYYGGQGGGTVSPAGVDSAIQTWTESFSEDNACSVQFTENGAVPISYLLQMINPLLADEYSKYIAAQNTETYNELYSTYTKPIYGQTAVYGVETFTADVVTETYTHGKATFEVQGIYVQHEGKKYIYGTAYYSGNLGGKRFNDAANIKLLNSNKNILLGGTLSWWSSVGDNNESGVSAWDQGATGINSPSVQYMVSDPSKDFAGGENTTISISDICVYVGDIESSEFLPEIGHTTFNTTINTESKKQGVAKFDVWGIKVEYNNAEYLYGTAYYSGNLGGTRFNDVAYITLSDCSKEIEHGGNLVYKGSYSDNNEDSFAGYVKPQSSANKAYYALSWVYDDFTGNEDVSITISGIMVKTGSVLNKNSCYALLQSTAIEVSYYNESTFAGRIELSLQGILCEYQEKTYLLGAAYYDKNPETDRFNDVATMKFEFINGESYLTGGTLFYRNSEADNNECGSASWDKNGSSAGYMYYVCEQPTKDNASDGHTRISISGICIEFVY